MSPAATSGQDRRAQGEAAARMPQLDVKATVVPCPKPPADDDFVGTLRGEDIRLEGVREKNIYYTKRSPEEHMQLRKEFESAERERFMKSLANSPVAVQQLRKAGLNDKQLALMQKGGVPPGWQVHHKRPLDDNGTNSTDNLVLIKNDPYHLAITNAQKELTKGLSPGESRSMKFPIPEGFVYPQ